MARVQADLKPWALMVKTRGSISCGTLYCTCLIPLYGTELHQSTPDVSYFDRNLEQENGEILPRNEYERPTIVRPSKMATFEEPSFVKRIGTLSTKGQGKVSAQLHEFIGVVEKG